MDSLKKGPDTVEAPLSTKVSTSAYLLKQLEIFNWGPFGRPEPLEIDPVGTAIVGPTGSGKTTLVDAFITLVTPVPKYNLASTGGHESDRDLMSYIRGVSGAGNNTGDNSHIARPGKTVTAVSALFSDGKTTVRIGGLFWIDGTSSAHSDLRRVWLFSDSEAPMMEDWLTIHHEGGIRALKQLARETVGFQIFDSKKRYIAHLRRFFEVGENAFSLLNRAAGLKQLNSVDEIFRELVLDDRSGFQRAGEVAQEFDTLKGIRQELEIALDQQKSLIPIERRNKTFQACEQQLKEQELLKETIPVWFADAGFRMWNTRAEELENNIETVAGKIEAEKQKINELQGEADTLKEIYLKLGGAGVEQLEARVKDHKETVARVKRDADDYRNLTRALDLDGSLTPKSLKNNQHLAADHKKELNQKSEQQEREKYRLGLNLEQMRQDLDRIKEEKEKIEARPGSNMPMDFQIFRTALARELDLSEDLLPFVAEMVEVKAEEALWRGAVERAIGGHRLRILVPLEFKLRALEWIKNRNNRLHIRVLSDSIPQKPSRFFEDGFTRKLEFKKHPQRELLKHFLAGRDRHCVETAQELARTTFGMTPEGLMSGSKGLYEKQDQKPLDRNWMTGFSNKDRLVILDRQIKEIQPQIQPTKQRFDTARSLAQQTIDRLVMLTRLSEIAFGDIDLPGARRNLNKLEKQLAVMTDPGSTVGKALKEYERVAGQVKALHGIIQELGEERGRLKAEHNTAIVNREKASKRMEDGLSESRKVLAEKYLPVLEEAHLEMLGQMERDAQRSVESKRVTLEKRHKNMGQDLVRLMGKAQNKDTGALIDIGTGVSDIPHYLERLDILTREALPEKRKRFLEYLTHSSDQGVTQLLTYIQNEVAIIEERIDHLNHTLKRVDFKPGYYLKLEPMPVSANSLKKLISAQRRLKSAALKNDEGESHYRALENMVNLLRDASERRRTVDARALLDPRYRLTFKVSEIERGTGRIPHRYSGSQGGSGGEKEIIASYILTASLSYALCPDGAASPLFSTIVLDEAFSKSSQATAGRIISALREFGLHPLFVTPNKEMRLLRSHTRSAVLIHRKGVRATMTSLSWEELDAHARRRSLINDEISR